MPKLEYVARVSGSHGERGKVLSQEEWDRKTDFEREDFTAREVVEVPGAMGDLFADVKES